MRLGKLWTLVLLVGMTASGTALGGTKESGVKADDFMPVVAGGSPRIQNPGAVVAAEGLVQADSAQDAINAAAQQQRQDLKEGDSEGHAADFVIFGSGVGAVATGRAAYSELENSQASRIAQRQAYVIAFNGAKKNLASLLTGLLHQGNSDIKAAVARRITGSQNQANSDTNSNFKIEQSAAMLLKGFVVYSIADENDADHPEHHVVAVTIAATPKTLGRVAHTGPSQLSAENLREGLKQVLVEVKCDLVPPVGGKTITVRATGETAVVGFGSTIRSSDVDPALQARLRLDDATLATEYATDSLCGILIGDEVSWEGRSRTFSSDVFKSFNEIASSDPLRPSTPTEVERLDRQRTEFLATVERTDAFRSARNGRVPPGTILRTWHDEHWVYAMAVYASGWTDMAGRISLDMKNSNLLKPYDGATGLPGPTGGQPAAPLPGAAVEQSRQRPSIEPGPTGRLNRKDL